MRKDVAIVGMIQGGDADNYRAIISVSDEGVKFECDEEFTLTTHEAMELAGIIIKGTNEHIRRAQEMAREAAAAAHEIKDPASLAALIPEDEDSIMMNGKRLTRVIRRKRTS